MFARTMLKSKIHRATVTRVMDDETARAYRPAVVHVNEANQVLGRGVGPAGAAPTN